MCGQCCTGEGRLQRLARHTAKAGARITPAAVLVLLPKCPLCIAVWLTAATGLTVSTAAAAWVRGSLIVACVSAIALVAVQFARRRWNL